MQRAVLSGGSCPLFRHPWLSSKKYIITAWCSVVRAFVSQSEELGSIPWPSQTKRF